MKPIYYFLFNFYDQKYDKKSSLKEQRLILFMASDKF